VIPRNQKEVIGAHNHYQNKFICNNIPNSPPNHKRMQSLVPLTQKERKKRIDTILEKQTRAAYLAKQFECSRGSRSFRLSDTTLIVMRGIIALLSSARIPSCSVL
jgi:hypothetical protein